MSYGSKSVESEFRLEYSGEDYRSKCILYEGYGNNPEIDVNTYFGEDGGDDVGYSHMKSTFRVKSLEDRECVFRKSSTGNTSEPSEFCIRALHEFGWHCRNKSLRDTEDRKQGGVRPTLTHVDDAVGALLRQDLDELRNPMIRDLIEMGQSGIALANSLIGNAEQFPPIDSVEELFTDSRLTESTEELLIAHCLNDYYYRTIIPELCRKNNLDIDITEEKINETDVSELSSHLQSHVNGTDWDTLTGSEIHIESMKEISEAAGSHMDNVNTRWQTKAIASDTSAGFIRMEFTRLDGSCYETPYVFNRNGSTFPLTDEEKVREIVEQTVENANNNPNKPYFATSVEHSFEVINTQ